MNSQTARLIRPIAVAILAMASGVHAEPVLWVDDAFGNLGKVDVATGGVTMVGRMGATMTDIAFDPTGKLYGITFNALYSIDPATAASSLFGSFGPSLNSLVFGSDGTLYGANNSLYTISTSTGAATLVGRGGAGYGSSGDLAFVGGNLYLSSNVPRSDTLVRIDPATGFGTSVGPLGVGSVFGLATNDNVRLYGVAGTSVYGVDTLTGAATFLVSYSGQGLSSANGTAFLSESAPPVPEPSSYALMAAGLGVVGLMAQRRSRRAQATA